MRTAYFSLVGLAIICLGWGLWLEGHYSNSGRNDERVFAPICLAIPLVLVAGLLKVVVAFRSRAGVGTNRSGFDYPILWVSFMIGGGLALGGYFVGLKNPWRKNGVEMRKIYGPTGVLLGYEFFTEWNGEKIEGTIWGPLDQWDSIEATDSDGDGIPEVIIKKGDKKNILSFKPANRTQPPRFEDLISGSWGP